MRIDNRPNLGYLEASPRARALAMEIVDIIKPEELYGIAQKFLNEERDDALRNHPLNSLLDSDCGCHMEGDTLMVCEKCSLEILDAG